MASGRLGHHSANRCHRPLKLKVSATGTGSNLYLDDVALFTGYRSSTYLSNGLANTTTEISGASDSAATTTSQYDYGATDTYATNLLSNGGFCFGYDRLDVHRLRRRSHGQRPDQRRGPDAARRRHDRLRDIGSGVRLDLPDPPANNATGAASVGQTLSASGGTTYSVSGVGRRRPPERRVSGDVISPTQAGHVLGFVRAPNSTETGGTDRSGYAYQTLTVTAPRWLQPRVGRRGRSRADHPRWRLQRRLPVARPGSRDRLGGARAIRGGTPRSRRPSSRPRVTSNVVSGGTQPDQNVVSVSAYDRWGRLIVAFDPDGIGSMTQYANNQTYVATTSDGLGDVRTTTQWDQVGNVLTSVDPLAMLRPRPTTSPTRQRTSPRPTERLPTRPTTRPAGGQRLRRLRLSR